MRVRGGYSKRRRNEVLPLRLDTAAQLRVFLARKLPAAPAFNVPKSDKTAKMIRQDLSAVRTQWVNEAPNPIDRAEREASDFLSYKNHAGLVADFDSLRNEFVTNLSQTGAHLPLTQKMARHSDPSLTSNVYTHITLKEQSKALAALPDLSAPFQETQLATGTYGAPDTPSNSKAFCVAPKGTEQSNYVQSDAVESQGNAENATCGNSEENSES